MPGLILPKRPTLFQYPWLWVPSREFAQRRCCCGGGNCTDYCQSGTGPAQYSVTFAGIANWLCPDCTTLNDTFILSWSQSLYDTYGSCAWVYELSPVVCDGWSYFHWITLNILSTDIGVAITQNDPYASGGHSILFNKGGLTAPFDCALANESIPYYTSSSFCTASSATCHATAL